MNKYKHIDEKALKNINGGAGFFEMAGRGVGWVVGNLAKGLSHVKG